MNRTLEQEKIKSVPKPLTEDRDFQTDRGIYHFDSKLRQLTSFVDKKGEIFNFTQEYHYYIGHRGDNSDFDSRASGAYIFRPTEQIPNSGGISDF